MIRFSYTIKDSIGIHARPAGMLVKLSGGLKSTITLEAKGKKAEANRLFAIMGLAAKCGDEVSVTVEGTDEENDAKAVQKFFEENL